MSQKEDRIAIGLGANLSSERVGRPENTIVSALSSLDSEEIKLISEAGLYRSAPIPAGSGPWYVNTVALVETKLEPIALLKHLHSIEAAYGRVRDEINAPRTLDLDLLIYHDQVTGWPTSERVGLEQPLTIPHPRMHERAFVLLPLAELMLDWVHPVLGKTVEAMAAEVQDQAIARMSEPL